MATTQPDDITLDDFRAIVASAGLPLDQAELEHLLPQYQQLQRQLQAIHDPRPGPGSARRRVYPRLGLARACGFETSRDCLNQVEEIMAENGTELHYLTIAEAGPLLRDRQISPVELVQAYLDRIEAVDGLLHSYVTLLPERALAQAAEAESEIANGNYRGPLHGIPIGLKDLYDTAGILTTAMSRVTPERVPTEDATTVAKLNGAGTILLGKLAMHEFALGGPGRYQPLPAGTQSVERGPHPRRVQQRLRFSGGGRPLHGRPGL